MLFEAKTTHVYSATVAGLSIDLGFGVSIEKRVRLAGVLVSTPRGEDAEELAKKAKGCLIVLIGGKGVLVEVDQPQEPRVSGRIFLKCGGSGSCFSMINGKNYLCINDFLSGDVTRNGFDPAYVRSVIYRHAESAA